MTALSSISPIAEAPDGSLSGEIGVEVGDWGNYDSSLLFYESNIPGYEKLPIWLEVIESIEWFIFEVIEVSGNNVTIQFGTYYEDGTKQFETRTGDPIAGSGNLADALAPAGLGPGAQFYIWLEEWGYPGPIEVTINETTSRTYAGESREVNHVTISLPILEEGKEVGNRSFEYYFDKETGICVDQLLSTSVVSPGGYYRYSWSVVMTVTNMWGPASAVIPDPQSVTETNPIIIDATETVNTILAINSISNSTIIKIENATEAPPAPSGLQTVGNSIFIDTSKMVTTIAVLKISYDPLELSEKGIVESSVTIHYWDGSAWVPVESYVNAEEHYVRAEIDHFSYWALMGEAAPPAEEGVPVVWIIVLVIGVVVVVIGLFYFRLRRR
jgi:hypothetical protein